MWLCEFCDAENVAEVEVCAECGKDKPAKIIFSDESRILSKAKSVVAANTIKDGESDEYELCAASRRLKKWGKILMFGCFGIGAFRFISNAILIFVFLPLNDWHRELFESRFLTAILEVPSFVNLFVSTLTWIGGGILIKLALDALAIIVQSAHLNINSKRGE